MMLPSLMLFIGVENYIKIMGCSYKKQGKKRFVFEFITQNNRFNSKIQRRQSENFNPPNTSL